LAGIAAALSAWDALLAVAPVSDPRGTSPSECLCEDGCLAGTLKRQLEVSLCELPLEKVSLILAFEGNLKPNTTISLGDRLKRNGLDFAVIQPCADRVRNISERTVGLLFNSHHERGIERHDALLSFACEAGA
jgi:hypothetical protein